MDLKYLYRDYINGQSMYCLDTCTLKPKTLKGTLKATLKGALSGPLGYPKPLKEPFWVHGPVGRAKSGESTLRRRFAVPILDSLRRVRRRLGF